jgi:hypothetical protein
MLNARLKIIINKQENCERENYAFVSLNRTTFIIFNMPNSLA